MVKNFAVTTGLSEGLMEGTYGLDDDEYRLIRHDFLCKLYEIVNSLFSREYPWWFSIDEQVIQNYHINEYLRHCKKYHSELSNNIISNRLHIKQSEMKNYFNENEETDNKREIKWNEEDGWDGGQSIFKRKRFPNEEYIKKIQRARIIRNLGGEVKPDEFLIERDRILKRLLETDEEHPTGWWDGDWKIVKNKYIGSYYNYCELFYGVQTVDSFASRVGISPSTVSTNLDNCGLRSVKKRRGKKENN